MDFCGLRVDMEKVHTGRCVFDEVRWLDMSDGRSMHVLSIEFDGGMSRQLLLMRVVKISSVVLKHIIHMMDSKAISLILNNISVHVKLHMLNGCERCL